MNVAPIGINRNTVNLGGRSKSLNSPNMSTPSNSTDTFQKSEGLSKKKAVSFEGFASEVEKMKAELTRLEDILPLKKFKEAEEKTQEKILSLARKLENEDSDARSYIEAEDFWNTPRYSNEGFDGLFNAMNQY